MEKQKFIEKYLPYVKWSILTVCLIVAYFFYEQPFSKEGAGAIITAVGDCFAVPGSLLMCVSALTYFAKLGAYDGIAYAFSNFSLHSIIPGHHKDKKQTLYEYKKAKDEKGRRWLSHAFKVALVAFGVGVIFIIIGAFL